MNESKRNIVIIVVAILAVVICFGVYLYRGYSYNSQLSAMNDELLRLNDQKTMSNNSLSRINMDIAKLVNGYDSARVLRDKQLAEAFFSEYLTFSNETEYIEKRNSLIEKYGDVLTSALKDDYYISISSDSESNSSKQEFGDALNLSYLDMEHYLVSMDDDIYSYVAFVSASYVDPVYDYSSDGLSLFRYSVDSEGNFLKIDGYVLLK